VTGNSLHYSWRRLIYRRNNRHVLIAPILTTNVLIWTARVYKHMQSVVIIQPNFKWLFSLLSVTSNCRLGVHDRLYICILFSTLLFMTSSVLQSCSHEVRWGSMWSGGVRWGNNPLPHLLSYRTCALGSFFIPLKFVYYQLWTIRRTPLKSCIERCYRQILQRHTR